MKRVVLFLVLALVLDVILGTTFGLLDRRTFTGDRDGSLNYALTKDAELLVLGSSRAEFHVMPAVLSRRLGMSAYNAGLKGQDLLYSMMLFDLWKGRHPAPRAIVMTVDVESLIERPTEVAAAQFIAAHIDDSELVREVLYSASPFKRYEYLSRAYRYNGQVLSLLKHARERPDPSYDGFAISPGQLDPESDRGVLNALDQDRTQLAMAEAPPSPRKVAYLRSFVSENAARGTRVFLLHTPLYRQDAAAHRLWRSHLDAWVSTLTGVEVIDLCTDAHPELFAEKPELYRNLNHLNARGAEILTNALADELQQRLSVPSRANAAHSSN